MTIIIREYFDEIIGKLKSDGVLVHHFTLLASRDALLDRLIRRGDGNNSWILNRMDRCVQCLNNEYFQEHIITDDKTIEEVADIIITFCNLNLLNKDNVSN